MQAATAQAALDLVRDDFPILAREVGGRPLVYLDNAATAQKPAAVIEAVDSYYRNSNANVHRSMHELAAEAETLYEGGRSKVAQLVGARPGEVVFVRNATEAINLVRFTWAREHVGPGDVVLITAMEHHSNVVPWQLLCAERGARLEYLEIDGQGRLDLSDLDGRLARGVKLVALAHVSNVLGTINPVAEVAERAHAADFYAFTGHKMYGPTGIGVLWGRRELLDEMPPFLGGGSMIKAVEEDHSTWAAPPAKFEAGTPAIAESAGLGAAADFMTGLGMEAVRTHERELTAYALERISSLAGVTVYGPTDSADRGALVSFTVEGIHPHDLAELCNREGVAIRAGHHCAQPLMRRLGVPATARASFAAYNTPDEVDRLIDALENAKRVFGA
jgi:cysteine desulfurase/selenocysteine lyase